MGGSAGRDSGAHGRRRSSTSANTSVRASCTPLAGVSLRIEGLWALAFGKGVTNNGNTNTLYFTAGAVREQGGVFGFLTAAATPEGVAGRP